MTTSCSLAAMPAWIAVSSGRRCSASASACSSVGGVNSSSSGRSTSTTSKASLALTPASSRMAASASARPCVASLRRAATTCRKKFTLYVSDFDTCWDSSSSSSLMRLPASSSRFATSSSCARPERAS